MLKHEIELIANKENLWAKTANLQKIFGVNSDHVDRHCSRVSVDMNSNDEQ